MENKGIKVLSICLAVLFAASILFLIIGTVIEYKKAPVRSQLTQTQFIQDTIVTSEYYQPGTKEFSDIMRAKIISNANLAATVIKQNNAAIFAYPVSSPFIQIQSNGEPVLSTTSALVMLKSKAVDLTGEPYTINTAIYTMQPMVIYNYIRITFLLILGGTLIAGIALLYLYLMDQQIPEAKAVSLAIPKDKNPEWAPVAEPEIPADTPETETELSNRDENPLSESEEIPQEQNDLEIPDVPDVPEISGCEQPQEDPLPEETCSTARQEEPVGLFSPVTGFGWESYLEDRLDSELVRSASIEEDIVLIIIKIENLDKTSETAKKIYEQLLVFFKFRDLIFEYKIDGFACIVHDITVDTALSFADQIYDTLSKIMTENGYTGKISIGISSRSFRLIPGKRLITEAEEALSRAIDDQETAIVAFRVNPEKYRQYIAESSID